MVSYIFNLVQQGDKSKKSLLSKANSILVEIIKKEWSSSWKTAVKDIVQSSYQSQDICENNLQILKELSQEIFDFSKTSITTNEANQLKENFGNDFISVCEVCTFVAKNYLADATQVKTSLVKTCLETLHSFLSWIPMYYILMTDLIETILIPFLAIKKHLLIVLKCFEEIFNLPVTNELKEAKEEARTRLLKTFSMFLKQISVYYNPDKNLELEREILSASKTLKDLMFFQMFCQNLGLSLYSFYSSHLVWIQDIHYSGTETEEMIEDILTGLKYMANLTAVQDKDIFKTCLEFWAFYTEQMKKLIRTTEQMLDLSNDYVKTKLKSAKGMTLAIDNLVIRTPKPLGVRIFIDEDGLPKSESNANTEAAMLYDICKEILINYSHINWPSLYQIIKNRIERQMDGSEFALEKISAICYAAGSIGDVINPKEESTFFMEFVRSLLKFTMSRSDVNTKTIVSTGMMHFVVQFKRFMKTNPSFDIVIVNKMFEFMNNKIDGVKEMACNTFLEICHQIKDVLINVTDEKSGKRIIYSLIERIPTIIPNLQPVQQVQVYEGFATIISACTDINTKRELIFLLMSHLEPIWANIVSRINDVQFMASESTAFDISFYMRINERICSSIGESYSDYFDHALANIDQVYKQYHWLIMQEISRCGSSAVKLNNVKRYRVVKTDILNLLISFVKVIHDTKRFVSKYSALIFMALENYTNEIPEVREAEVLIFLATSIETLKKDILDLVYELLPHILNTVLPMITQDFSSYPEHRQAFFTLVQAMVKECFEVFFKIPADLFKTVIDCVIWAMKHDLASIYEIGLDTLHCILSNVNQNIELANQFYKFYFQSILDDLLFVLLDGAHTNGFSKQTKTLYMLLIALDYLTVPIFNTDNNKTGAYEHILTLMLNNFSNLAKEDHERLIKTIFESVSAGEKAFKMAVRDYIISLNLYTNVKE